jgi:hypothetical protein
MPRFIDLTTARKPRTTATAKVVWRAVRHARRFVIADIQTVTALSRQRIAAILAPWRQAGIVRVDNDGFRLARDLGPQPPFRVRDVNGLISARDGEVLPFEKKPKKSKEDVDARRRRLGALYSKTHRERLNARRRERRAELRK